MNTRLLLKNFVPGSCREFVPDMKYSDQNDNLFTTFGDFTFGSETNPRMGVRYTGMGGGIYCINDELPGGVAVVNNTSYTATFPQNLLTIGKQYVVKFTLKQWNIADENSLSNIGVYLGSDGVTFVNGTQPGTFEGVITADSTDISVIAVMDCELYAQISYISVQEYFEEGDTEIDLKEDVLFSLNYQVDDISNPENRRGSFSKTITLPGTARNNRIFNNIFHIENSSQFNPNKKLDIRVTQNEIEIFNGILKLDNIVINGKDIEYEVTLYSNVTDLFTAIGDAYLEDLDMSEYNHALSETNQLNSWGNYVIRYGVPYDNFNGAITSFFPAGSPDGKGYVYFLANTGRQIWTDGYPGFTYGPQFRVSDIFPAIYVKEYVDKIFRAAGFTYTSNFFDSTLFKKLVIPPNDNDHKLTATQITARKFSATTYTDLDQQIPYENAIAGNQVLRAALYNDINSPRFDNTGGYDTINNRWVCQKGGTYTFTITAGLNWFWENVKQAGRMHYFSNNGILISQTPTVVTPGSDPSPSEPVYFNAYLHEDSQIEIVRIPGSGAPEYVVAAVKINNPNNGVELSPTIAQAITSTNQNSSVATYNLTSPPTEVSNGDVIFVRYNFKPMIRNSSFGLQNENAYFNFNGSGIQDNFVMPTPLNNRNPFEKASNTTNTSGVTAAVNGMFVDPTAIAEYEYDDGVSSSSTTRNQVLPTWVGNYTPSAGEYFPGFTSLYSTSVHKTTGGVAGIRINQQYLFFNDVVNTDLAENEQFDLNTMIPKQVKQAEFLSSIFKMFNIFVVPNNDNPKNLLIEPREDLLSDDIIDWTNKLDISKDLQIRPIADLEAKVYNFTYTPDNDYKNKEFIDNYSEDNKTPFGYRKISFDNDFLAGKKDIQIIFSPTQVWDGGYDTKADLPSLVDSKFLPMKTNIRILFYNGVDPRGGVWTHVNQSFAVDVNTTRYLQSFNMYDDMFDPSNSLVFGHNGTSGYWDNYAHNVSLNITNGDLYNKYYSKYIEEITSKDSRLITGYFKLSPVDIFNLDFSKVYLFNGTDGNYHYCRLYAVLDYDPISDDVTKVQFIKALEGRSFTPATIPSNGGTGWVVSADGTHLVGNGLVHADIGPVRNDGRIVDGGSMYNTDIRFTPIDGLGNAIAFNAEHIRIIGHNNTVMGGTQRITIMNSDNVTVLPSVRNVTIINTSNIIVRESDVIYIAGARFKNGTLQESQSEAVIVNGGVDELQSPYTDFIVNYMDGGEDKVQAIFSDVTSNVLDGGVNGVDDNYIVPKEI